MLKGVFGIKPNVTEVIINYKFPVPWPTVRQGKGMWLGLGVRPNTGFSCAAEGPRMGIREAMGIG